MKRRDFIKKSVVVIPDAGLAATRQTPSEPIKGSTMNLSPQMAKEVVETYKNYQDYFLTKALNCVDSVEGLGPVSNTDNAEGSAYNQGYTRALKDISKELRDSFK